MNLSYFSLRIKIRSEINQALIDEGYSQKEITNELSDLLNKEIQRLEREAPERQHEREHQEAEKQ